MSEVVSIIQNPVAQPINQRIIDDWNNKRNASNNVLSSLVPFVELIALVDDEKIRSFYSKGAPTGPKLDFVNNAYHYKIVNDYSFSFVDKNSDTNPADGVFVRGIPLSQYVSQLSTKNKKGGFSIENLSVEKGNAESLNTRITADFVLADASDFDERYELKSIFELRSSFIVSYGWRSDNNNSNKLNFVNNSNFFSTNSANDAIIIDVGPDQHSSNGSFYTNLLVSLWKFDFGFDDRGRILEK